MSNLIYNGGLDEMAAWTTGTYRFLLLNDPGVGVVDLRTHRYIADLSLTAYELLPAYGYIRATATGATRTIDDTGNRITYDCNDPTFGTIETAVAVGAMVLYRFVTSDSDSPAIALYDLTGAVTDGTTFEVVLPASGLIYTDNP